MKAATKKVGFIKTPEQRFFSKIDQSAECWIWTAALHGANKYGVFYDGEKNVQAHRFSYEINICEIPKGMVVMHSCDNPKCVNPDHLSVGTQLQNVHDAIKKKRLHPILNGDLSKISIRPIKHGLVKYRINEFGKRMNCKKGHDISTPESVYINKNRLSTGRICRICNQLTKNNWVNKRRESEFKNGKKESS